MTSEYEQRLLGFLADVREQAREKDPELARALHQAMQELAAAFSHAPLDARYDLVIRFYREYTSRIYNFLHPVPEMDWFGDLKYLSQDLLTAYWRGMGREHYDPASFPKLPLGSLVRMRRLELQVMDVLRGITQHVGWANSKGVWEVEDRCDTDVDGVPVYWVERQDTREGAVVRQTALLPA